MAVAYFCFAACQNHTGQYQNFYPVHITTPFLQGVKKITR
jgi:hypothetical protein